jgi:hypothetical protein
MTANDLNWRVSVATLDRVIFPGPEDGTLMLALERRATLTVGTGPRGAIVRSQPFGGAIRIRDSEALHALIGDFSFDSERSQTQQDFRILIRPSNWERVKQVCLEHLENPDDPVLESDPCRELVEELAEGLEIILQSNQYTYRPVGFVVENRPTPTDNVYSPGHPTVRIYRIFEVRIVDAGLRAAMLTSSRRYSDQDLQTLAFEDAGNPEGGRANSVLALPLKVITGSYLAIPSAARYALRSIQGHQLDASVLAILEGIDVPQFQWL